MARVTKVQSQVESYQRLKKWYLIPPCLTLSIIRYVLRVKWSNPSKGVVPFPTPVCSSYWKGSFQVALTVVNFTYYIYVWKQYHHQAVLMVRSPLTLSVSSLCLSLSSLSFLVPGWFSKLHPVSTQSWCIQVFADRPALVCPCVGVHRRTLRLSSSLLLQ